MSVRGVANWRDSAARILWYRGDQSNHLSRPRLRASRSGDAASGKPRRLHRTVAFSLGLVQFAPAHRSHLRTQQRFTPVQEFPPRDALRPPAWPQRRAGAIVSNADFAAMRGQYIAPRSGPRREPFTHSRGHRRSAAPRSTLDLRDCRAGSSFTGTSRNSYRQARGERVVFFGRAKRTARQLSRANTELRHARLD